MPRMWKFMKRLEGGLGNSVAVINDGRFSGGNRRCFVCYIFPEAAEMGHLLLAKDREEIIKDFSSKRLTQRSGDSKTE